jgi:1,2-diacylglycerol 3-beta-galactosyltransferase
MEKQKALPCTEKKVAVNILTVRMGGGHYAALNALSSMISQQQRPWEIRVTDIDEVLDYATSSGGKLVDPFKILLGIPGYELWNQMFQKGWTWLQPLMLSIAKLVIQFYHDVSIGIFEGYWREQHPDLVVSLVPLYNRGLWDTLQKAKPGTPVVTILVDFADSPPHFWIEPKTESYVVCGTDRAVEQARSLGVKEERIFQTSGMIIHPRFYEPIGGDRRLEKQRLGLDPDRLTGLVLFGGLGSMVMLEIAKRLECFKDELQLIFICGHNEKVAKALNESQNQLPKFVTNFTKDIPYYMHLSDFFIGKPGPASISEALAMKLPVIVEHNATTLIAEKYNSEWIQQKQVGLVIPSFRKIDRAVKELLKPEKLAQYRANVAAINNRAVFEIPDILQKILELNMQQP